MDNVEEGYSGHIPVQMGKVRKCTEVSPRWSSEHTTTGSDQTCIYTACADVDQRHCYSARTTSQPLGFLRLLTRIHLSGDLSIDVDLGLDVIELLATILARLIDVHDASRDLLSSGVHRELPVRFAHAG